LRRVVGDFAALVGFVLTAPRADLFAEGETRELTAASNAVCHGFLKEYQQFAADDKVEVSAVQVTVTIAVTVREIPPPPEERLRSG
jgi:hypothetical protein